MKELSLEELKIIEVDILKQFDSFCKENNIRYYLSNGTLLGAVKYKGFIPWDDDIDVLVPREDYDRFLKLYKDNMKYKLYAFEKDGRFHYPYAKLCDLSTRKVMPQHRRSNVIPGVEIDIFPLDCWHPEYEMARKEVRSISREILSHHASQLRHCPVKSRMKALIWQLISIYAKICTDKYFNKKIIKMSRANKQNNPTYLGCKVWCIYGEKEIIPAKVFEDIVFVEFEGEMFPAPIGYDTYLTSLYGDYWSDPPKEKQKSHHSFKAYRL